MPEISIKHIVSFSSEDKVHKAENLVKPETYRKWKCATPGEKSAVVVLQFEKAYKINSIDIGNESSAFIEVQVRRSSDTANDFQVLLVASSFMSPLESRNGTHTNRVRMFGPEKLSKSTKDEKWDCVQITCTQPFNKTITYGLTFVKFHTSETHEEAKQMTTNIGNFKLRYVDEDDDALPTVGSWFQKQNSQVSKSPPITTSGPTYASVVLDSSNTTSTASQNETQKRKIAEIKQSSDEPPTKKAATTILNKDNIVYKGVSRDLSESKEVSETNDDLLKTAPILKSPEMKKMSVKTPFNDLSTSPSSRKPTTATPSRKRTSSPLSNASSAPLSKPTIVNKPAKLNQSKPFKVPFEKIMDRVVFVLSGFLNPLRSELRDKALEMGAKYKGDWDSSCTHLICAFPNTPKAAQVKKLNGRIVTKEWILESYKKKRQIPCSHYIMGRKSSKDSSEESDADFTDELEDSDSDFTDELEDSEEEYVDKKERKKNNAKKGKNKLDANKKDQTSSPVNKIIPKALSDKGQQSISNKTALSSNDKRHSKTPVKGENNLSHDSQSSSLLAVKDESETEDEEALQDYIADTDKDDDSGGDTEDEIRRVEMEIQKNGQSSSKKVKVSKEDCEYLEKPDVTDLPLPQLLNLFKQKHFFLFGDFSSSKLHDMNRYIVAYNGVIEDYMSDSVKYVITDAKWDKQFDDALNENEDLIFVKPTWIYKCHDAGKLVPYQPYIVIPDT